MVRQSSASLTCCIRLYLHHVPMKELKPVCCYTHPMQPSTGTTAYWFEQLTLMSWCWPFKWPNDPRWTVAGIWNRQGPQILYISWSCSGLRTGEGAVHVFGSNLGFWHLDPPFFDAPLSLPSAGHIGAREVQIWLIDNNLRCNADLLIRMCGDNMKRTWITEWC